MTPRPLTTGSVPARRPPLFPLVRHVSLGVTPLLMALPVTANQVTAASLAFGLAAALAAALGTPAGAVGAGVLLVLCYVADNCDGEVARGKNQCSEFGRQFDSFVDWVVHSLFFVGLGFGTATASHDALWLWLGLLAAAGGTINYGLGRLLDQSDRKAAAAAGSAADATDAHGLQPATLVQWLLFILRELTRADFCFIVLGLALAGWLWVLVPAGAIGAQVYWVGQFSAAARRFHV